MKISIVFTFTFLFLLSAQASEDAFRRFFDNQKINSRMCGMNIKYFLQYLDEQGEWPEKGYVVSLHEDVGYLNHFDARWGSITKYQDGSTFKRSNWYFHVFAILDGKAYDFSQDGAKVMDALSYLKHAYLPKSKTENVFFQGVMDKESELKKYANMKMNIYPLDSYKYGKFRAIYSGKFIELFNYLIKNASPQLIQDARSSSEVTYQKKFLMINGGTSYKGLRATKEGVSYPISLRSQERVCLALGHLGYVPGSEVKFKLESPGQYLDVYASLALTNPKTGIGPLTYRVSASLQRVSPINGTWDMLDEVICNDLKNTFH